MVPNPDHVADEEWLYRSVRVAEIVYENDVPRASSHAFSDLAQCISVDRALLVDNDPRRSRMSATDAVVRLLTSRVRGSVPRRDAHGNEVVVDVMADPIKEDPARGIRANPAHAVIYANPHFV